MVRFCELSILIACEVVQDTVVHLFLISVNVSSYCSNTEVCAWIKGEYFNNCLRLQLER